MKRNTKSLFVLMISIIIVASSCGQGAINPEVADNNSQSPAMDDIIQQVDGSPMHGNNSDQPVEKENVGQETSAIRTFDASTIEIILDENLVTKETIGPEGGSFSVTDGNGTQYTLVIPEGALLYDEEITMTPIANIEGEVISEVFQAGIRLEPEGLHFLELVSIEIISTDIEEGAVGFTTQSGGENFHLIPSITGKGVLTITTTHFTDFGVSDEMIEDITELSNLAGDAWLEYQLAKGDANAQLAALNLVVQRLLGRGKSGIVVNNWEPWTVETMTLILRTSEISTKNDWNENTPGFIDLMTEIQKLVDLWFQQSEGVVQEIREKCIQGEIAYLSRGVNIIEVGEWLYEGLSMGVSKYKQYKGWGNILEPCINWEVTWQANVLTTGSGLQNDISLGAERNVLTDFLQVPTTAITNLEIEYVEGFLGGLCEQKDGKIDLKVNIEDLYQNLGKPFDGTIEGIIVHVKIIEDVFIDCGQGYSKNNALAQRPFHGEPLDRLNSGRKEGEGYWVYEFEYNPGGGVIAQFEEGPLTLNWSEGQYKLWQLVTLYQSTTPD